MQENYQQNLWKKVFITSNLWFYLWKKFTKYNDCGKEENMRIGITSDHRGFKLKNKLFEKLKEEYNIVDFGTFSEESVDYPDYAFKLGEEVAKKILTMVLLYVEVELE